MGSPGDPRKIARMNDDTTHAAYMADQDAATLANCLVQAQKNMINTERPTTSLPDAPRLREPALVT
jgi:hypothetical protein